MADNSIARDLLILADETNPATSEKTKVYPNTTLDQVYDQLSPDNKSLREILDDLRTEIISGGIGSIVFPVQSVNGKTGRVQITPADIGLENVDNTADVDKPLSGPQKDAIESILNSYEFDIDLSDLYNHINNHDNPHGITLEQIDVDHQLEKSMENLIKRHNYSTLHTTHADIRRGISGLWKSVEVLSDKLTTVSDLLTNRLGTHLDDGYAHLELMNTKENIDNKISAMTDEQDNVYYPSANAVADYVTVRLEQYTADHPPVEKYIDTIRVIDYRDHLPDPSPMVIHTPYIIRYGIGSHSELAICSVVNNQYIWDYISLPIYSKYDDDYFYDSIRGLTIDINNLVDSMLNQETFRSHLDSLIEELVPSTLGDKYYTKDEIDQNGFIRNISIMPGTQHGTIRYYLNNNPMMMSDDVKVPGLQRLAFMEYVYSGQIYDNAIRTRHITDKCVTTDKLTAGYHTVLGNITDGTNHTCSEISLHDLADALIPFLSGRV